MAARHGTATRYTQGCRRDACKASHRRRAADYRQRRIAADVRPPAAVTGSSAAGASGLGAVESAVRDEIGGLAAQARPGLAQATLAIARILDNPKAVNQQPAAAKVLAALLDKLLSASARRR